MSADQIRPLHVPGRGRCWVHCPTAPEAVAAVEAAVQAVTGAPGKVTRVEYRPTPTGEPGWIVTVQPAPKEDER